MCVEWTRKKKLWNVCSKDEEEIIDECGKGEEKVFDKYQEKLKEEYLQEYENGETKYIVTEKNGSEKLKEELEDRTLQILDVAKGEKFICSGKQKKICGEIKSTIAKGRPLD